ILCPSCGSSFRLRSDAVTASLKSTIKKKLGRFEILQLVGAGAFGSVYKARDPKLERIVAVKVPRAGKLAEKVDVDRFMREGRSAAQFRHPAIVSIHEVGTADGVPYLVSDFVKGVTLSDWLTANDPTPKETAQLVNKLAKALAYAHEQGVVHRDVKPANIM